MVEALFSEHRVSLAELAAELGVTRVTVTRWADTGFGGRRLENFRIGKKRYSSREATQRFVAAMNDDGVRAEVTVPAM